MASKVGRAQRPRHYLKRTTTRGSSRSTPDAERARMSKAVKSRAIAEMTSSPQENSDVPDAASLGCPGLEHGFEVDIFRSYDPVQSNNHRN